MYEILKYLHSWNRWLVLGFGFICLISAIVGWLGKKPFGKTDRTIGGIFVGVTHLQLVAGLLLYFVFSEVWGFKAIAANGMGVVMKNPQLRYWVVEHFTVMLLAVILVQVGRTLSKKASSSLQKHKKSAIFYGIALVLMLSRIPWDRAFGG
jgi:Kef-type K+ transport system membrane component KefB